jgi:hypothetical protein
VTPETEGHDGDAGHGGNLPSAGELAERSRAVLEAAWRSDGDGGFCVPNQTTYPWQWLWDSCFHAVVWARLDDERAVLELESALVDQDDDGFVPHLRYVGGGPHDDFWGRATSSSITQPPMYGHALAALHRRGVDLPEALVDRAWRGLRFLLEVRPRTAGGLVQLCHPWESGCDDSPRWDGMLDEPWSTARWYDAKGAFVARMERTPEGGALRNPAFPVGSAGFSALVAWNALELASVAPDDELVAAAHDLVASVDARWDPALRTWIDDGPTATTSGRVRTLDALLPALVAPRSEALASLADGTAFAAPFGPRGVHPDEPTYSPSTYWRGSSWPQLAYLLWVAAVSSGSSEVASNLARSMTRGVEVSGFAEHWAPDTGAPLGAVPQSWSTLACVMREA